MIWVEKEKTNDKEKFQRNVTQRNRLSLGRKRAVDPQKVKHEQNERKRKHRKVESASDRLKEFKEATLYNAVFICTCCHQRMFKSNVRLYDKLKEEIDRKRPGQLDKCIDKPVVKIRINGQENTYICETCVRYLRSNKMPPMSVMNGLKLEETDEHIRNQGLQLTELEGALIAKNIIFQKIFQLPKSRWTALKDRVINVPINDEAIINTLEKMPRAPKDAGLIGVALKRKQEYTNTHKRQLINPEKLFKVI